MVTTTRELPYDKISRIADVLKAISHPVRMEVLQLLEVEEPLSASAIQQKIEIEVEQSMLSHHLIKMKDKGILVSKKEGKHIYYSILDRQILKIFDCMQNCKF